MNCKRCKSLIKEKYYETEFHDVYKCENCSNEEIIKIDDCCRAPNKIIVNDVKFLPNFRLYEQCTKCGGAKRNFPIKYTKDIEIRDEFNLDIFNKWRENTNFDRKITFESVQYSNYLSSPKGKYHLYLESSEWKKKRKLVFQRDEYICQQCKVKSSFHVHHLTYDNIFNERLEDLVSVCADCHSQIHYDELMEKIEELRKKEKIQKN